MKNIDVDISQNLTSYEISKEELEQELEHYTNMYVFFKDLCFNIFEKKITIDQLAQILYGFDRGHDA
jgi:hypothetical protein